MSKRKQMCASLEGVDLLAMLTEKHHQDHPPESNIKAAPLPNKKGIVNYFGYMDDFFKGQPPVASRNWIIDNVSLSIVTDLTGQM